VVLHLALRERALAVLGRLDLTALEGGTLLVRAGLPVVGRLDVEAMAFRDGALYFGLKSPLTRRGGAVIVRLAGAVAALKEGRALASAVSRWAELPLCLEVRGRRVCQGLSDMAFLPDGSLALTANAPKGSAWPDGGGALWWLPSPEAAPVLVRHFEGLKPEGVAVSPASRLVVVFDSDQGVPEWAELPLPSAAAPRP
jgi:hypothetical protein